MSSQSSPSQFQKITYTVLRGLRRAPPQQLLVLGLAIGFLTLVLLYTCLSLVAPIPRPSTPSEKKYRTNQKDGSVSAPTKLPCWFDTWRAEREAALNPPPVEASAVTDPKQLMDIGPDDVQIEDAEVFMSVVVPAYNEEERLEGMLEEAVEFLGKRYGNATGKANGTSTKETNKSEKTANGQQEDAFVIPQAPTPTGWEILIVSDGSTDNTTTVALNFAKTHNLPTGALRVVDLENNRGKGGAVTHGMRHVRGAYVVFADADGASKFADLEALVLAAEKTQDDDGRVCVVGSRAHLVGSEAVVKRSLLRNALMRAFHLFIRILTPPATSRVKDTQCGFKLFSRPALPHIIPYMHMEGWIFDVEMLMLSESAGIPIVEVPVGWREVGGSKLNVVWDSLGMAWGLAVLRGGWGMGVYRRW